MNAKRTAALILAAFAAAASASEKTTAFVRKAREVYPTEAYAQYRNTVVRDWSWPDAESNDVPTARAAVCLTPDDVRWVNIPYVRNARDLGGWNGLRTNVVFRGSQLYRCNGSPGGVSPDTRTALAELGIVTDLDLRGDGERSAADTVLLKYAGLSEKRAGMVTYMASFSGAWEAMRTALLVFTKEENYPVYFHCKAGADRTGTLAMVLEGLCGVSETDLVIDYELTSCPGYLGWRTRDGYGMADTTNRDCIWRILQDVKSFGGSTLMDKFAACAKYHWRLTDEQIWFIRSKLMVNPPPAPSAPTGETRTFTWTGKGVAVGGRWSDALNWSSEAGGYPHQAGDVAVFEGDATVLFDLGREIDIDCIRVTAGEVTVSATAGSVFRHAEGAGSVAVDTSSGAVLHLDAPYYGNSAVSGDRMDKQYPGTVHFTSVYSNATTASGGAYLCCGTNVFAGSATAFFGKTVFTGLNSQEKGKPVNVTVRDSARFDAPRGLTFGGNDNAPWTDFVIDGESAAVTVGSSLVVGNSKQAFAQRLTLRRGVLDASSAAVTLASKQPAVYLQEGGSASFKSLSFGSSADSRVDFTLSGGTCTIGSAVPALPTEDSAFRLLGGVLHLTGANTTFGFPVEIGGAFTLDGAGRKHVFAVSPELSADSEWTIDSPGGSVTFNDDLAVGRSLTVAAGSVNLESGVDVRNAEDVSEPFALVLKGGATLNLTDISTHLSLPLDLTVEEGAELVQKCDSGYAMIFAHSAKVGGQVLSKGLHTFDKTTSGIRTGGATLVLAVPCVWTGAAGDGKWNTPGNWRDSAVPGSTDFADISAATSVTLDADATVCGVIADSNAGERKVTLTGSGTLTLRQLSTAAFARGIYVGVGSELVIDVNLAFNGSGALTGVSGGGTCTFTKAFIGSSGGGSASMTPAFCAEGTLRYRGVSSVSPVTGSVRDMCFYACGVSAPSQVVLENCTLELNDLIYTKGGFVGMGPEEVFQRGGSITAKRVLVNRSGSNFRSPTRYTLESGFLTATDDFALNGNAYANSSWRRRFNAHFRMTGGTVTAPKMTSERIENCFLLEGGDVYLGSGGFDYTENDGAGNTRVDADYTTYLNKTPPLQLGGATVHATADLAVRLDTVLTGTGGMARIDTGTHDVTFAAGCSVSGSGGLAKTGTGTLTFAGVCTFSGSLAVNDGQVAFAEGSTVPAALKRLSLSTRDALVLPQGSSMSVGRLTVGGERLSGSVTFGGGTVTVTGETDKSGFLIKLR